MDEKELVSLFEAFQYAIVAEDSAYNQLMEIMNSDPKWKKYNETQMALWCSYMSSDKKKKEKIEHEASIAREEVLAFPESSAWMGARESRKLAYEAYCNAKNKKLTKEP